MFLVHPLVVPQEHSNRTECFDAGLESIAEWVAPVCDESFSAEVKDVSGPELVHRAGLAEWPGFDLLSRRTGANIAQ